MGSVAKFLIGESCNRSYVHFLRSAMRREEQSLSTLLTQLIDQLGRLLSYHLALFRLEIAKDARAVASDLLLFLVAPPFLLMGYALLCVSAAQALSTRVGLAWGTFAVAGFNFLLGGLAVWWGMRRVGNRRWRSHE